MVKGLGFTGLVCDGKALDSGVLCLMPTNSVGLEICMYNPRQEHS